MYDEELAYMIIEAETSHALLSKSWRPKKAKVYFQSTFKAWEPESWQLSPVHGVWRPEGQENQQGKLWSEPGDLGSRSLEMEMSQFKGQRPRPTSAVRQRDRIKLPPLLFYSSPPWIQWGSSHRGQLSALSNPLIQMLALPETPWPQHTQKVLYQWSGHSMTQVDWSPEPWPSDTLKLPPSPSWNAPQDQRARRKPGTNGQMELCPSWAWSWVMQEGATLTRSPANQPPHSWGCLENQEEGCVCDAEAMDSRLAWYTDGRLDCLSSLGSMKQGGQSRLEKSRLPRVKKIKIKNLVTQFFINQYNKDIVQ